MMMNMEVDNQRKDAKIMDLEKKLEGVDLIIVEWESTMKDTERAWADAISWKVIYLDVRKCTEEAVDA